MSKENEKIIIDCAKKIAKKNHFKTISDCIYLTDEDLVINAVLWATDKNSLTFRWEIKTVELDDIFWDIFDMADNKNERFSLRIIGAFCCPAYVFDETTYEIENMAVLEEQVSSFFLSELDKVVKSELKKGENGGFGNRGGRIYTNI